MSEEVDPQEEEVFVFGIPVPNMTPNIQPLECLILIKGINMEDGSPTMTTIGSSGITYWESIGMMDLEIERIKFMSVYNTLTQNSEEDENPPD